MKHIRFIFSLIGLMSLVLLASACQQATPTPSAPDPTAVVVTKTPIDTPVPTPPPTATTEITPTNAPATATPEPTSPRCSGAPLIPTAGTREPTEGLI